MSTVAQSLCSMVVPAVERGAAEDFQKTIIIASLPCLANALLWALTAKKSDLFAARRHGIPCCFGEVESSTLPQLKRITKPKLASGCTKDASF